MKNNNTNTSNNKQQQRNSYELPRVEPWSRKWIGGAIHSFKNQIGGAFPFTKKEWHRMIEERNRKAKALKASKQITPNTRSK
jgi:hypothetical protein